MVRRSISHRLNANSDESGSPDKYGQSVQRSTNFAEVQSKRLTEWSRVRTYQSSILIFNRQ